MKITKEWLKEKNSCREGYEWFLKHFGDEADYQDVLDALAEENLFEWAKWLLQNAGPTKEAKEIQGNIQSEKSLFFSGSIKISGFINCKLLLAGGGIEAGGGIKAGWGIEAGGGIEAGEGIKAGEDFGIYVGLHIRISKKSKFAFVISKTKPKNILLGEWRKEK